MVHGTEPLLPLDITEATFLFPEISAPFPMADLLAACSHQLLKRDDDLTTIHNHVLRSRLALIADFERRFANIIHDHDFQPGDLVLVLNRKVEPSSNAKCKPRYFGPMLVVSRSTNGSYHLAEVDGSMSKLKFATFHLVPYFSCSLEHFEVTKFLSSVDLTGVDEN